MFLDQYIQISFITAFSLALMISYDIAENNLNFPWITLFGVVDFYFIFWHEQHKTINIQTLQIA